MTILIHQIECGFNVIVDGDNVTDRLTRDEVLWTVAAVLLEKPLPYNCTRKISETHEHEKELCRVAVEKALEPLRPVDKLTLALK